MKLASYKALNGVTKRDGHLMVVSRDLTRCADASAIAPTMQAALDDWAACAPLLKALYDALNDDKARDGMKDCTAFDETLCASPLPRAYQIADGSAYLYHVELVRKARGAQMPPEFLDDPLMYQAVSDTTLAPRDPIRLESTEWGIDFEAEICVITDDVPAGIPPQDVAPHIKLVMLMNDVSLRGLIPQELGKGFGFFQSKPPSAFSPVAVTPDELGAAWNGAKLNLPLLSTLNGKEIGRPNAGHDMQFGFDRLVSHAARTRPLGAGAVVGSGTISNRAEGTGVSCLAEIRMIETIENGKPTTPFMGFGDHIRIEMLDEKGRSIFGAIDQRVEQYTYTKSAQTMKKAS